MIRIAAKSECFGRDFDATGFGSSIIRPHIAAHRTRHLVPSHRSAESSPYPSRRRADRPHPHEVRSRSPRRVFRDHRVRRAPRGPASSLSAALTSARVSVSSADVSLQCDRTSLDPSPKSFSEGEDSGVATGFGVDASAWGPGADSKLSADKAPASRAWSARASSLEIPSARAPPRSRSRSSSRSESTSSGKAVVSTV